MLLPHSIDFIELKTLPLIPNHHKETAFFKSLGPFNIIKKKIRVKYFFDLSECFPNNFAPSTPLFHVHPFLLNIVSLRG